MPHLHNICPCIITVVPLQFSQKRFTIIRQFKDILQLHDDLISSMFVETGNGSDDVTTMILNVDGDATLSTLAVQLHLHM